MNSFSFFTPLSKKTFLGVFFSLLLLGVGQAQTTDRFITRWDLSKTGATATELSFGVQTAGIVNYTWQQVGGTASGMGTFNGTTATISGLPTGATVDVSIAPTNFQRIIINDGTDKARLMEIKQWGSTAWTSMENAFRGCSNMTLTATDVPNLVGVTSMWYMFANCSSFNQPLPEGFNPQNVTTMRSMFENCTIYNQALPNSFNTAKVQVIDQMFAGCRDYNKAFPSSFVTTEVTRMASVFNNCVNFNQPLTFNTAKATTTGAMFAGCINYNQPLPNSFNTANVTDMGSMFFGCTKYNQPFPSSFSIAKVTFMVNMFGNASAFNQSLAAWGSQLNPTVNLGNFLNNCGMSVANYDATLTAFNASSVTGRNMGAIGLKYCTAVAERANLVLATTSGGKGWTITGDMRDSATATSNMIWTGTVSTDWNTACNWSPGGIPTATNQVIIPDVTNKPNIASNLTATARSIILRVGSGLTNNGTLIVGGVTDSIGSTITNNACGRIFVRSGNYVNMGTTANAGSIEITNNLNNTGGTFTNTGVLKYGTLTSTLTNSGNSAVVVNNTLPIFTYGGTFSGTVNGIFRDSLATVSAGTFTAPNEFRPLQTIPTGVQTLYAKITVGACSYVVPFTYNYTPRVSTQDVSNGTILYQNRPNPFNQETVIAFVLPATNKATLTVFDISGRQVFVSSQVFNSGYNEVLLNKSIFKTSGTYIYRLTSDTYTVTKRMQFVAE
jgi:hypothetical protein